MGRQPAPSTTEINTRQGEDQGVPSKFGPMRSDVTDQERRLLLAKVIEVAVRLILSNHTYQWKGETWLQSRGVPTGLRVSGVIGRIVMDHWKKKMGALMTQHKMVSFLLEKYVDDAEVVVENVAPGTRWTGAALTVDPVSLEQDLESDRSKDEITMQAWRDMASSLVPGLDFTVDYCSKNKEKTGGGP